MDLRKIAAAGSLVLVVVGGVAYFAKKEQAKQPTPLAEKLTYAGAKIELLKSYEPLCKQFDLLPLDTKVMLIAKINARADAETGLGTLYDSIIATASPQVVSLTALANQAKEDIFARDAYTRLRALENRMALKRTEGAAAYDSWSDRVIVWPENPAVEIRALLQERKTRKEALAHESLHKIQADNSVTARIQRYVNSLAVENRMKVNRDEHHARLRMIVRRPEASSAELDAMFARAAQSKGAGDTTYELAARLLCPELITKEGKEHLVFSTALITPRFYSMDAKEIPDTIKWIGRLYGHFSESPAVDIEVSKMVGSLDGDVKRIQTFVESLPDKDSLRDRSTNVFSARHAKLERVREIALEELGPYLKN